MPWGFTRDDLLARRDEAAGRTGRGAYEQRAHSLRWLDFEAEALRWFRAAVEEFETRVLAQGRGRHWTWRAQYGCVLRRAGDVDGARQALEHALEGADSRVELEYLLGRLQGGEGLYGALAARDLDAIRAEREGLVRSLRADRSLPGYGSPTLDRYEQLEETFRVEAGILGEPLPDHATMLSRTGLLFDSPPLPPVVVPPAAGTWKLRGEGVWKAFEDGAAHVELTGAPDLEIIEQFGDYFVRVGDSEGSPLVGSFGEAIELAGDMLRAQDEDAAVATLAELLAHAQSQRFELTRAVLEADRDDARDAAGRARAHRWLDEPEAASRALREALGDERDPERLGWLLRLAGDDDAARQAFERALEAARDEATEARLLYLLGRYDDAPYHVESDPVAAVDLCDAHRRGRPAALKQARDTIAATIRTGRLLPASSAVYDWLEETFHAGARMSGQPVPSRREMLVRVGLWRAAPAPPAPPRPTVPGRRTLGAAALEVGQWLQLTVTFGDGLELQFESGTLELWRDEERLALREGYGSLAEELAAAAELVPQHLETLLALLQGADRVIEAENERSMAWAKDRSLLGRLRDEAKPAGDAAGLARALRWLGEEEEASELFRRAAGQERDAQRRGSLLWSAGDYDAAREALTEALAAGRAPDVEFELRCLLGEAPPPRRGVRAAVFAALNGEHHQDLADARNAYVMRLNSERVPMTAAGPTLGPYDLVWEAIRVGYAQYPLPRRELLGMAGFFWVWDDEE